MTVLVTTVPPGLHVPDEPIVRAESWLRAVHEGQDFDTVLTGPDGVSAWLWARWRSLAAVGIDEDGLTAIVQGYRRELWLWLVGERTWAQCCSGLIGRITRRIAEDAAPG